MKGNTEISQNSSVHDLPDVAEVDITDPSSFLGYGDLQMGADQNRFYHPAGPNHPSQFASYHTNYEKILSRNYITSVLTVTKIVLTKITK